MSAEKHEKSDGEKKSRVERLLFAAANTVSKVKNCWIITLGPGGQPNARVISPIPGLPEDAKWTIWFLTSSSSRKAAEIRVNSLVTFGFQHDPDSAYVTAAGRAVFVEVRSEIASRWNPDWNAVFPAGASDPDAVFVKVQATRIELWNLALGVTPAPFGKRAATLSCDGLGRWSSDD